MARPLTGQREMFRRLQENNEAKKERVNQVRELGGLEPLEEPRPNEFLNYIEHYLGEPMPYYQQRIVERATDEPMVILTGGRPNRNHTAYTQEIMRKLAEQMGVITINTEMTMRTAPPRGTWSYIEDAVNHLNPCFEILQDNSVMAEVGPSSPEDRIAFKKHMGHKLESNEDFAFLLNDQE